jgi:HSP20 family protein
MAEVKEAPKPKTEAAKAQGQATEVERRPTTTLVPGAENPFAFMHRFAEEMERLFEDFWLGHGLRMPILVSRSRELLKRERGIVPAEWSPRIDVLEKDGQFTVRADLPGLSKDDVKVEVTEDLLTIQGERRQEKKEEREGYSYNECSYGSFYRSTPLPEGADASKATAEFRNGVLEVTIPAPTQPAKQVRRLEVQEKK